QQSRLAQSQRRPDIASVLSVIRAGSSVRITRPSTLRSTTRSNPSQAGYPLSTAFSIPKERSATSVAAMLAKARLERNAVTTSCPLAEASVTPTTKARARAEITRAAVFILCKSWPSGYSETDVALNLCFNAHRLVSDHVQR